MGFFTSQVGRLTGEKSWFCREDIQESDPTE